MALFVAAYLVLYWLYLSIPDDLLEVTSYNLAITAPCARIIQFLDPGNNAHAVGGEIIGDSTSLKIVRGCDGVSVYLLLVAAMIGVAAPWPRLLSGLFKATIFVYSINLIRIVGLYFVVEHHPFWFTPIHDYVFPTLFVMFGVAFFLVWGAQFNEPRSTA